MMSGQQRRKACNDPGTVCPENGEDIGPLGLRQPQPFEFMKGGDGDFHLQLSGKRVESRPEMTEVETGGERLNEENHGKQRMDDGLLDIDDVKPFSKEKLCDFRDDSNPVLSNDRQDIEILFL
jgi:hypothetical protein